MKISVVIRSSLLAVAFAFAVGFSAPGCVDDGIGGAGGTTGTGVAGTTATGGTGVAGTTATGGTGVAGTTGTGVAGTTATGGTGVAGTTGIAGTGVAGSSPAGRGGNGSGGRGGAGGSATGGSSSAGRGGNSGLAGRGGNSAGGRGGGAGGATGGTGGAPTFAQVASILGMSCGTGMCHNGQDHTDLRNNTGLYARIVNAMPTGARAMAACTSRTLVKPSDLANSVIAQVIMAPLSGCTNARMPDDCPSMRACLTTAQISTITSWITAGAPM